MVLESSCLVRQNEGSMRETTKIVAVILVLSAAAFSGDKEVTFDSIPSGAQVELDGRVIGTTPLKWRFPGYYFGRKTLAWSSHASQPAQIRLMKDGYTPKVL